VNSSTNTAGIIDTSQRKAARVAGFMFLFSLIVPSLNWALVLSTLIVKDNVIATTKNIMANESLFRIGITIELIMAVGLVVLGMALYTLFKTVNKSLALLALCWKLVESSLAAIIVLVSFIALQMSNGDALSQEQMQAPVGLILSAHTSIFSIPMIFLGLDMMVFSYLFFKSKFIPRILGGFGVLSFALIFIHALMYILAPQYAVVPIIQIIFWAPSGLLELTIGIWLLTKGIAVPNSAV
jgi:hypothetical protein